MSSSEWEEGDKVPDYRVVFGVGTDGTEGIAVTPRGSRAASPEVEVPVVTE